MKQLTRMLALLFAGAALAQQPDFYDLRRIDEELHFSEPDTIIYNGSDSIPEAVPEYPPINIRFVKNAGEAAAMISHRGDSFLVIYYDTDTKRAEANARAYIKDYLGKGYIAMRTDFLEHIDNLYFYITGRKEDLQQFGIFARGNKSLIAIRDTNGHTLYKVEFAKYDEKFLDVFGDYLGDLYKYSTFDRIIARAPLPYEEFKSCLWRVSHNLYDDWEFGGYVMLEQRDEPLEVEVEEYWPSELRYSLETYKLKATRQQVDAKVNELFAHYAQQPSDYYMVEILLSEMVNNGYTSSLFLSDAGGREGDFRKYIDYVLEYDASLYDKAIMAQIIGKVLLGPVFRQEERREILRRAMVFSGYTPVACRNYQEEILGHWAANPQLMRDMVNGMLGYYGNDAAAILQKCNDLYQKYHTIYTDMQPEDIPHALAAVLDEATWTPLMRKQKDMLPDITRWNAIALDLDPGLNTAIAISAVLKFRAGDRDKALGLKAKAINGAGSYYWKNGFMFLLDEIK